MTFKGMLKILINDYRKQHDAKLFSVVQELMRTQRELREVKEQLRTLQLTNPTASSYENVHNPASTISLYIQYNGFFNELRDIRQTITIEELLVKLRHLTGIPIDRSIRLRVLSEDGLTTLFFLHQEPHRTLESYNDCLKPRMILSIEESDDDDDDDHHQEKHFKRSESTTSSDQTHFFDESDV